MSLCTVVASGLGLASSFLLVACGGTSPSGTPSAQPSGPTGQAAVSASFDVNGHQLFIECTGSGSPTMVLEVGEARARTDLGRIQDAYRSRLRVCTYDRANKGRSGKAATPRSGPAVVSDLHGLLRAAEVPGPYLLVGHSAGGLVVMAYAAAHPEETAGLVAINPVAPWRSWLPVMARMTRSERAQEVAFLNGDNGESLDYRDLSRRVDRHLPTTVPAHLLVSSPVECPPTDASCPRTIKAYDAVMQRIARQWDAPIEVVDASHDIQFDDLDAVTAAIDDVLSRAQGSGQAS